MASNKVQFNLKNVHYAPITAESEGTTTWGAPVHVPGAVSLALEQQGELTKFYADGIVYWQGTSNNGYEGDLEMAQFPDQMLQDIWGFTKEETDNVLVENATVEPKAFALLFQIDGDKDARHYCLYNCTGTRPGINGKTNEQSKTPQTQTSTISAAPLADGRVQARTGDDTSTEVVTNWYKKVYEKAAAAAAAAANTAAATTAEK